MSGKAQPRKAPGPRPVDAAPATEKPAISAERKRALLAAQEAVEDATDRHLRLQAAAQRAQAAVADAGAAIVEVQADRDLEIRLALRESRRSGDDWAIHIDPRTDVVEFRKREEKPKG